MATTNYQTGTVVTKEWLNDVDTKVYGVKEYGAVGDGVTDDSAAIAAALAAATNYSTVYFPTGNYLCKTAITFPNKQLAITGEGSRQSVLIYGGTNTTNDCFTFVEQGGLRLKGIGFSSNTVMTGGAGVRFTKLVRSVIEDVLFSHQDGNTNFYHGVWFDGFDYVTLNNFQAKAQQDGLRCNGNTAKADLLVTKGKIGGCEVGIRVGGDAGGIHFNEMDIISNATNVIIDQSIVATANRETTFGSSCMIDSACTLKDAATFDGVNVHIKDSGGFITFKDTWIASAGTNIRIDTGLSPIIRMDGSFIYNAITTYGGNGHGIECNSTSAILILNGTRFKNCQTTGVYAGSATGNITLNGVTFDSDVTDNIGANVNTTGKYTVYTDNQAITGRLVLKGELPYATCISGTPDALIHGSNLGLQFWANNASNAWLSLEHSRGTTPGTHTTVQTNDQLGGIVWAGSDGTAFRSAADIIVTCSGTPAASQTPGNFIFRTNLGSGIGGRFQTDTSGNFLPGANNTYSCGKSGLLWTEVWATNGTIQTSDERGKKEVKDIPLGLDFINKLRPISYKWIHSKQKQVGVTEESEPIYEDEEGVREHYGLIAQQVKQVLDESNSDFGGWILTDKNDPTSQQALRYGEFIAPLIKAIQELSAEVEKLKNEKLAPK